MTYRASISGSVSGAIMAGVAVTLTGPVFGAVMTDSAGSYGFVDLADGRYTVTQILTLLPGGKLYNQLIIHNLIQRGVLKPRESQEIVRHPGAPRLRT